LLDPAILTCRRRAVFIGWDRKQGCGMSFFGPIEYCELAQWGCCGS
jgi:hypothetical protein